jgi:CO/xanthine dehydrogenase FAD-binding subunit
MNNFVALRSLPTCEYHRPKRLREALEILGGFKQKCRIVAGGTDLLPALRQGKMTLFEPAHVVDISSIPGLKGIAKKGEWIQIGAAAPLTEVTQSPVIRESLPMLAEAAGQVGSLQIRNQGTLGGNLCNASPAADTAVSLLALNAKVSLKSMDRERIVSLDEFFVSPGKTILKPGEILTKIQVPVSRSTQSSCFVKLGRRNAFTLSVISVATVIKAEDGTFQYVRMALGAVAPTPMRPKKAEEFLTGREVGESVIDQGARIAAEEVSPISDVRASAEYRKDMAHVLTKRALLACLKKMG